jgi:hypothetical protein
MATKIATNSFTDMLIPPVRIADHFQLALFLLILGFFIICWLLL